MVCCVLLGVVLWCVVCVVYVLRWWVGGGVFVACGCGECCVGGGGGACGVGVGCVGGGGVLCGGSVFLVEFQLSSRILAFLCAIPSIF